MIKANLIKLVLLRNPMHKITELLSEYGERHDHQPNKSLHSLCDSMILIGRARQCYSIEQKLKNFRCFQESPVSAVWVRIGYCTFSIAGLESGIN